MSAAKAAADAAPMHSGDCPCLLEGAPELMTVEQAARLLQVSPGHLRIMCRCEKVPSVKIGKAWRLPKSWLLAWLLECE